MQSLGTCHTVERSVKFVVLLLKHFVIISLRGLHQLPMQSLQGLNLGLCGMFGSP
jgi:hypothetical protein